MLLNLARLRDTPPAELVSALLADWLVLETGLTGGSGTEVEDEESLVTWEEDFLTWNNSETVKEGWQRNKKREKHLSYQLVCFQRMREIIN